MFEHVFLYFDLEETWFRSHAVLGIVALGSLVLEVLLPRHTGRAITWRTPGPKLILNVFIEELNLSLNICLVLTLVKDFDLGIFVLEVVTSYNVNLVTRLIVLSATHSNGAPFALDSSEG